MKPKELQRSAKALFGDRWRLELASRLKVNRSTIHRYANGEQPIPGPVEAAIRAWADAAELRRLLMNSLGSIVRGDND